MKELSCGAVIFIRDAEEIKYLILKYGAGHYDFVKGHVEHGEAEVDTIKREAEEETGLKDLKIIPDFRHVIMYFYKKGNELLRKEVIFYLGETKTKEINLSFEHTDFYWLPFDKALDKITFKNSKEILKKADELLHKS